MTTAVASRSARKPARVPCPVESCTYTGEPGSSIAGHVSMAHPDFAGVSAGAQAILDALATSTEEPDEYGHVGVVVQLPVATGQIGAFEVAEADALSAELAVASAPTSSAAASTPDSDGSAPTGSRARRATPEQASTAGGLAELDLDLVDVGHNVRINVAELEELAASIAEHGVLQPIKATGPHADGRYLVTWGQRRTLASRMAGRSTIPAIVLPPTADVDADGAARSIEQLVENLHRADLPAMDRARSIKNVIDSGVTAAELARKLGIAPSTISNDLGLLEAPAEIQQLLEQGKLTAAHSKAMKGLAPKTQVEVARMAVEHGFSAHRTEQEVQERKRRAELEAQLRKDRAEELEQRRTQVDASIAAAIEKYKIPLDAEVLVEAGYYGSNDTATWLVGRLEAAGLTRARKMARWNEAQARPGGGTCVAESLLWGLLSYRIPDWAEAHGGSKKNPFAAIHALSDEELAKSLAMEAASDFRDKAGYHVDWQALADEIDAECAS